MRILLIDDDRDIVEAVSISFQLQWRECEVIAAFDGREGLEKFYEMNPDIVLLDVNMPELNGFEVVKKIRLISDTPVVMLTARGEELDKVRGLEAGADDYIAKPFGHLELFARIRAVMRRAKLPGPITAEASFRSGDLAVNFEAHEVTVAGKPVKLTTTEYNLLYHLVRNAGRVLPHSTLLSLVWGDEYRSEVDYLKVYISRLRSKIEEHPDHPRYILTERGTGYRFAKIAPSPV